MKFFKILLLIMLITTSLWCAESFGIIEKWHHQYEPSGYVVFSLVDNDGHVMALFFKTGNRLITPGKVIKFAPVGQGPGDLMNVYAVFPHEQDIAFVERTEKIKIFTKKDGTYAWKKTVWPKRGKYIHVVADGLFYDHKWFISGWEVLERKKDGGEVVSFLKVYDEQAQPLKNLLNKSYTKKTKFHQRYLMTYHLVGYKDYVFFIAENELKADLISVKELEVKKEVKLEVPKFYKKMPADFYTWKEYLKLPENSFEKDLQHWKSSYCRINKVIIEDNFLVLQIRTCSDNLKKFALLFYNPENFKLEKTIYTDDLLLGSRNGKYYFFAGGDPAFDEVEDFSIHIYSFLKKQTSERLTPMSNK